MNPVAISSTPSLATELAKLYHQIGPTDTRFLELLPSPEYNANIECHLRVGNVAYWLQIQFEALSYTWGENTDPKEILVDGLKIEIRSNLESFLRQRRQKDIPIYLWVDALCINQQDKQEKNHQIPLMNLIYAGAKTLTVWLGPASDDSNLAIEWLKKLGSDGPFSKMPVLSTSVVRAFQNFLSRRYWSRIWIVQELILGAMGDKLGRAMVTCGEDKLPWVLLVIAVVRMKADQENLRQYFPNIDVILQLDSLRERVFGQLYGPNRGSTPLNLDLLSRYRHFQSTDPRDKVYAIANMFAKRSSERLEPEYRASVESVFTKTAKTLLAAGYGPEMLRNCGHRAVRTPSWVPDWSFTTDTTSLPNKFMNPYDDVPWWTDIQRKEAVQEDGTHLIEYAHRPRDFHADPEEANRQKQERLRRLEVAAEGSGMISSIDEIPSNFSFHSAPQTLKNQMEELLKSGKLAFMISENDFPYLNSEMAGPGYSNTKDALTESQRITEKRFKKRLAKFFKAIDSPYHAAGDTKFEYAFQDTEEALELNGIRFDTIKLSADPFVDDVEKDWTNATRFMLTAGKCKALATSDPDAFARYGSTEEQLHEAFWLTLFAGQHGEGEFRPTSSSNQQMKYTEWLPEVPKHWTPSSPPLTVTTSGRLVAAQNLQTSTALFHERGYEIGSSLEMNGLIPVDWTTSDIATKTVEFDELGRSWHSQPYDLYHRPFNLLNVVPDPYWHIRKHDDQLAIQRTKEHISAPLVSFAPPHLSPSSSQSHLTPGSDNRVTNPLTVSLSTDLHNAWKSEASIVPQGVLDWGIERYALGRRFFISSQGYLGLAPKEAREGDTLVILFGVDVPMLTRKGAEGEGWEVVGECYVHGVMDGEVVDMWREGKKEVQKLTIV